VPPYVAEVHATIWAAAYAKLPNFDCWKWLRLDWAELLHNVKITTTLGFSWVLASAVLPNIRFIHRA
jgi:hypothetical protein